jgi:hypothetical protein
MISNLIKFKVVRSFIKLSNIQFPENYISGSKVVACVQTDGVVLIDLPQGCVCIKAAPLALPGHYSYASCSRVSSGYDF